MDMIRLNRQFQYFPFSLLTFLPDERFTICFDTATQNRLAPLWTPDQMVDYEMYSMLILLVFQLVDNISYIDNINNRKQWLKPRRKPAYPLAINGQRLAAGYFSVSHRAFVAPQLCH